MLKKPTSCHDNILCSARNLVEGAFVAKINFDQLADDFDSQELVIVPQ